jgi:predicted NBD/HSP70 family sugar kinase
MEERWRCFTLTEMRMTMSRLTKINQENLREHNLSVVLKTLLASRAPLSRAQLAASTGLTKAAMSLLSNILINSGVVRQLEPAPTSGYGRPATPLGLMADKWVGIGLQINTDGFGFAVVDITGHILQTEWNSRSMVGTNPADIFAELGAMVLPTVASLKKSGHVICGSGLALPGLVRGGSVLLSARNLGWGHLNLADFDVVRRLKPRGGNEADFAAIAQIPGYASSCQSMPNVLKPSDSFIYLSSDVGIGGAIVADGQLTRGLHGYGGEIGHLSVSMTGPVCVCGRRGCLETYAGRRALVENAGIASHHQSASKENAHRLVGAWKAGESKARHAVDLGKRALASALTSVVNTCDIDTIVLGGFWTQFDDQVLTSVQTMIQKSVIADPECTITVLTSPVSNHAALVGAADVGLRVFIDHPSEFLHLGSVSEK